MPDARCPRCAARTLTFTMTIAGHLVESCPCGYQATQAPRGSRGHPPVPERIGWPQWRILPAAALARLRAQRDA